MKTESNRFGNLLVSHGVISEKDLEEALQRQVIFGGRLGTNLVEMGSISEENLLKVLSQQFSVPYAEPHMFEDIPRSALESIPQELVERFSVVPLARDNKRIILAMLDPRRLDQVDEISFRTNCQVKPVVATELRINQALQRYYGIKRDTRYIAVTTIGEDLESITTLSSEDLIPLEEEGEAHEGDVLEQLSQRLLKVTNRDDVARVIVKGGLEVLDDVLLFILKGNEALGWMAGGQVNIPQGMENWKIALAPQYILNLIQGSHTLFKGNGADVFKTNPWMQVACAETPQEVIAYPLLLKGRPVAAMLGFARQRPLQADEVEYLIRLMRKATIAFEVLILKTKVLML